MSTALALPSRYQGIPSLEGLSKRAQSLMRSNRNLREETKGKVSTVEAVGFSQLGAALCGVCVVRGWSEGSLGMLGGGLAVAGLFCEQSALVHVANGMLAPLTAKMAGSWYAGMQQQQQRQQQPTG